LKDLRRFIDEKLTFNMERRIDEKRYRGRLGIKIPENNL
jgi:hypothetical protein